MPPITITIRKNGPYFIHADDVPNVRLVDHEGHEIPIPGKNIALCRCGASSKKPFCDGTHKQIGFLAEAAAPALDAAHAGSGGTEPGGAGSGPGGAAV